MNNNDYLEKYPIYKALINDVEKNINKKINYISLDNGESAIGRFVYDVNVDNVTVEYILQNGKHSEALIEKLKEIYGIYKDVTINSLKINNTIFDKLLKPVSIIINIPCEFNKKCYLTLDIVSKQNLRIEAANYIKKGMIQDNSSYDDKEFKHR